MVITNFFKKLIPKNGFLPKNGCLPKINKRNRTGQKLFRDKLIAKFINCPLDNIHYKLCEAAHILPYSDCKNKKDKFNVNNGILLSSTMHKAFDRNLFTIDEKTCKVRILEKNILKLQEPKKNKIKLEELGLDKIKDKYIKLLDNTESKEYLKKRNKNLIK